MKIAVVVSTFPPYKGGIGNAAYEISRILSKQGHEVVVFTARKKDYVQDNNDLKVERLIPWLHFGQGALLLQLIWKLRKFETIYLHYPFFGSAEAVWFFKLFNPNTKLIIHYHMDNPGFSFLFKILSMPSLMVRKKLFKMADKVICSSLNYIKNSDVAGIYNKMPNKFIDIPYGVDINKFRVIDNGGVQKIKNNHGIGDREKVILFIGGLDRAHYFKGVDNLINAVSTVNCQLSTVKLVIVGKGELKHQYQELAKELGISDRVIFADNVSNDELPLYYNLADVFVLPSIDKSEAFGIVLVEAMACGAPVIASNLAGVRTVFKDGEQGLLIKVGDIEDLTDKLKQILQNDDVREKMGQAGIKLVEDKYDWDRIGDQYKKIMSEI